MESLLSLAQDLKPYGLSSVPDVKQVMLEAKHKASSVPLL